MACAGQAGLAELCALPALPCSTRLGDEVSSRTSSAEEARRRRPDRCLHWRTPAVHLRGSAAGRAGSKQCQACAGTTQCKGCSPGNSLSWLTRCATRAGPASSTLRPCRKFLEERSREARAELEAFDRRRRERQAQAQRQAAQQERQQAQQREREKERER